MTLANGTITVSRDELRAYRQVMKTLNAAILSLTATMKGGDKQRAVLYESGIAMAQVAMAETAAQYAHDVIDKSIEEHGE